LRKRERENAGRKLQGRRWKERKKERKKVEKIPLK